MRYPVISVITVCKNAEKTIPDTIQSVLCQEYSSIEYVFIDGNSTDSTYSIIENYSTILVNRHIKVVSISEDDAGIYDAMNKGISYATGDWVCFLNANDSFCDKYVLSRIFGHEHIQEDVMCVYGNSINHLDGRLFFRKGLPMETIYYRVPFYHQSLFVRRNTLIKYGFDTKWKKMAEFDQFLRMYLDGIIFKYVDVNVAYFDLSGVSQNNNLESIIERERIQAANGVSSKRRMRRVIRNLFVIIGKDNKNLYGFYIDIKRLLGRVKKQEKVGRSFE